MAQVGFNMSSALPVGIQAVCAQLFNGNLLVQMYITSPVTIQTITCNNYSPVFRVFYFFVCLLGLELQAL
jgi:hypothetical protein